MKAIFQIIIALVLYYLSARMGLELATVSKQASPVWPATGVAMALVYLFGPRMSIAIFIGAFFTNFQTGLPITAAALIAFGNSLEALLGVLAFQRLTKQDSVYGVHSKAIFLVFVLFFAAAISATVGTATLVGFDVLQITSASQNWITWWVGDFLGALFLVPIAYKLGQKKGELFRLSTSETFKLVLISTMSVCVCYFVFVVESGAPFVFLVFSCILLAVFWFDSFFVYAVSLFIGIFSIWQTVTGNGPFSGALLNDSLLHLQIFLAGLGLTALGLGSLKQEGLLRAPIIALVLGWSIAGATFYLSYTSTVESDEKNFRTKSHEIKSALESKMWAYVRLLESGVSFIDASEYVSKSEWSLFSKSILASSRYAGIEGVGVIFSGSISKRAKSASTRSYQPQLISKPILDVPELMKNSIRDDDFVISYIEPRDSNLAAIGLNISTEKTRYAAAIKARDTGKPTITGNIMLVQDHQNRPGTLILVPFYAKGFEVSTVEQRRQAFLGFVYAPVILENFLAATIAPFLSEISFLALDPSLSNALVFDATVKNKNFRERYKSPLTLVDRELEVLWDRGPQFHSSASLFSSWIGFFGAILSLLLAVTLSSLQFVAIRAKKLASEMTKEINERRRVWQTLTETSPVGIFTTDRQGSCTYVNLAWEKMSGLTTEEAKGEGWLKALHPEDVKLVYESWSQLVGGGTFLCAYRFLRQDGSIRYVNGQATATLNEAGQVDGYLGTVQDISELHHKQVALITSSRLSSLGQMASGIAHEINNPLAIIQAKATLVEKMLAEPDKWNAEKAKSNLVQISSTVQRIAKIIRGLQAMARETELEPFQKSSLCDVLGDAVELCRERFKNHNIELRIEGLTESMPHFWGRPEQISQVFLNLINNAFDAAIESADRWVHVTIKETGANLVAVISDSGAGIPATIVPRIFDPFFTSKEIGKGTGLGLSISRGIVEKHKGRIYLDLSKLETSFVLELPKMESPTQN